MLLYGKAIRGEQRSIIVIDGPGCSWNQCKFCAVKHQTANIDITAVQIRNSFEHIPPDETKLQIVSSASFSDYDIIIQDIIFGSLKSTNIEVLILEQRWGLRKYISDINNRFKSIGIKVEWILGLEAVAYEDRDFLGKEPYVADIKTISEYYQRVNLLYGYSQKSFSLLKSEVETIRPHFNMVSINIYENADGSDIKRDNDRVEEFYSSVEFIDWLSDPGIDILDSDPRAETDFGNIDTFAREYN